MAYMVHIPGFDLDPKEEYVDDDVDANVDTDINYHQSPAPDLI